jgi:hypothetical protein
MRHARDDPAPQSAGVRDQRGFGQYPKASAAFTTSLSRAMSNGFAMKS